jgi:transcriptional regulator with GAF, ATPase, and Fis domain
MKAVFNIPVVKNILKTPFLRNLLLGCLIITFLFPLIHILYVSPRNIELIVKHTEKDALCAAKHLVPNIINNQIILGKYEEELKKKIWQLKDDFQLEKLKLFSQNGEIIYSTHPEDMGQKNSENYFSEIVAKGNAYTKFIPGNTKTLEGRTIGFDVVETYVPIMKNGEFVGSLEIYYNITQRKKKFDINNFQTFTLLSIIAVSLFGAVLIILLKASKSMLDHAQVQQALQIAHDDLEGQVETRTVDLIKANEECMVEIAERSQTEQALKQRENELEKLKNRLHAENVYLQEEIKLNHKFEEIIGSSDAIKQVLHKSEQVASTDATILIRGETGTGKELIAWTICRISSRNERPFIKVNCAALPSTLIESELFGHKMGAFTGAVSRGVGRFELADSGTIFLDEIAELPLELQAKLLHVLQNGEFHPVGNHQSVKVDVRVIAATNQDLAKAVKNGTFREDLYYRLNVVPINCPPLRERQEDIPILVRHFVKKYSTKFGKHFDKIPAKTLNAFQAYSWPGNVRELENIVERAVILSEGSILQIDELLSAGSKENLLSHGEATTLIDVERTHILNVLDASTWVIEGNRGAAKLLGLNPSTLRFRMRKLGIKRPPRIGNRKMTPGDNLIVSP